MPQRRRRPWSIICSPTGRRAVSTPMSRTTIRRPSGSASGWGCGREGLFRDFISFVNDDAGQPIYVNTYQYALLRRERDG